MQRLLHSIYQGINTNLKYVKKKNAQFELFTS